MQKYKQYKKKIKTISPIPKPKPKIQQCYRNVLRRITLVNLNIEFRGIINSKNFKELKTDTKKQLKKNTNIRTNKMRKTMTQKLKGQLD